MPEKVAESIFIWRTSNTHYICVDDEHSDGVSEHHRHVCVLLHAVDSCCRGGRHSHVTQEHI